MMRDDEMFDAVAALALGVLDPMKRPRFASSSPATNACGQSTSVRARPPISSDTAPSRLRSQSTRFSLRE